MVIISTCGFSRVPHTFDNDKTVFQQNKTVTSVLCVYQITELSPLLKLWPYGKTYRAYYYYYYYY